MKITQPPQHYSPYKLERCRPHLLTWYSQYLVSHQFHSPSMLERCKLTPHGQFLLQTQLITADYPPSYTTAGISQPSPHWLQWHSLYGLP